MTEALSQFKYVLFFLICFIIVPILSNKALKSPKLENILFFFLLFFTARIEDINFYSMETYRITTKGFEVGAVDICALIFYLIIKKREPNKKRKLIVTGGFLYLLYFFFSSLSIVNSEKYIFSLFELFKMLRMYFFYWVVYHYIDSEEKIERFLKYISYIIIYIIISVLDQKYVQGQFQCSGPFPHQNSLVMYTIVFGSIIFSRAINFSEKSFYYLTVFGCAGIAIISTLSRAGMALFALGCTIIVFISIVLRPSFRKFRILFILSLGASGVIYKSMDTVIERFQTAPEESSQVRILLAQAALKMVDDKALGIGLNNFGVKINPPYPYGDHIEHQSKDEEYEVKNGLVETIYLMIAAETGWHNLFTFLCLLLLNYYRSIKLIFSVQYRKYRYIFIGLAGGLFAIYLESTLEWVLKQTNNFYQLMLIFSIISAFHDKKIRMKEEKVGE